MVRIIVYTLLGAVFGFLVDAVLIHSDLTVGLIVGGILGAVFAYILNNRDKKKTAPPIQK